MRFVPEHKTCKYCSDTDCQNEMCETEPLQWETEREIDNNSTDPLIECETSDQKWDVNTY